MKEQKNQLFFQWEFMDLNSASFFYLKKLFTMPIYTVKHSIINTCWNKGAIV